MMSCDTSFDEHQLHEFLRTTKEIRVYPISIKYPPYLESAFKATKCTLAPVKLIKRQFCFFYFTVPVYSILLDQFVILIFTYIINIESEI